MTNPQMSHEEIAHDAARLISLSLSKRQSSVRDEYQLLLDRYLEDTSMHRISKSVARGLGLEIIGSTPGGLIIQPLPDSLMDPGAAERDVRSAVAMLAILAAAFPRSEMMEEAALNAFTVEDVQRELQELIDQHADEAQQSWEKGRENAWALLRSMPASTVREKGTRRTVNRHTREHLIMTQLRILLDEQLIREENTTTDSERTTRYWVTESLKVRSRHLANTSINEDVINRAKDL